MGVDICVIGKNVRSDRSVGKEEVDSRKDWKRGFWKEASLFRWAAV